jgi:hypothetical protein
MKNSVLVSVISIFIFAGKATYCPGQISQEVKTAKEQNIQLFNGNDLTGWYIFLQNRGRDNDPKGVFTVKDGLLRISGEEWGCITTHDEFENYRLVTEFKWGTMAFEPRAQNSRDSGILLHSEGEDGGSEGIWMYSIECQIIEGGTGDFIVVGDGSNNFRITSTVAPQKQGGSFVFQPNGQPQTINQGRINWFGRDPEWKDVFGYRGKNDLEKPVGGWNTLECLVNNGQITIFLNGVLVNEATEVHPSKGRIQIQSESSEIFFRRVELSPL